MTQKKLYLNIYQLFTLLTPPNLKPLHIFQEELANSSNNDTGIDVNDVSTADETTEDVEKKTDNQD